MSASVGPAAPRATDAPTRITLIRHGQTANNNGVDRRLVGRVDVPLTARGQEQLRQLRQRLRLGPRFAAIYASPLRRAFETARAVSAAGNGDITICRALQEIDCGDVEGWPFELVDARYPGLLAANMRHDDEEFRWPGGESYRDFRCRALRAVRTIARAHPGEEVAVVTHAGFISQILGVIYGASPARWDLYRPTNASLTTIEWGRRLRTVHAFDDYAHLVRLTPIGERG